MKDKKKAHLIISGKVQGVCFRLETQKAAKRFGVYGWVRNLPDGTVEALLEGEKSAVDALLKWCHQGPLNSRVDKVNVDWHSSEEIFNSFDITY